MISWFTGEGRRVEAAILVVALGFSSCSSTIPAIQGPVGMVIGGSRELPKFANPEARACLLPGIRDAEIIKLIGNPDRRLLGPASERWVWDEDIAISGEHLALLLDIHDGCQVGSAVFVQVQKPKWMMYAGCLLVGMAPEDAVRGLGPPSSRQQSGEEVTYTWTSGLQLRREGGRLWYSEKPRQHSLQATFRRGRLVDVLRDG
jgi:hypothetical protein